MRIPSLHIGKDEFAKILKNALADQEIYLSKPKLEVLINTIFSNSKSKSLFTRGIVESTEMISKKINKITKASTKDTIQMSNLIFLIRKQLKHKGVVKVDQGSKDWNLIKSITDRATEFATEFDLDKSEGYKEYIKTGISMLSRFRLQPLISMYQPICERYEALKAIREDSHKTQTSQAHDYFRVTIAKYTGSVNSYENIPEKYVYFIKAVDLANQFGVTIKKYMDAQLMYFLEGLNKVPTPEQLVTEKAKIRLNHFLLDHD